ncbi:MAG: general secretion pathway protein GspF [Ectothiorhodospiraceae bacterium]|jgi:hypothetical protein
MSKRRQHFSPDEPLRHPDHRRPMTRREFIAQGFLAGAGTVLAPSILGLLGNPRVARAAAELSPDIDDLATNLCGLSAGGGGRIPFICFDLAGGANIAGSNVLVGGAGGQMDFLQTAGYNKLGVPGDIVPGVITNGSENFDTSFGLAFHSDSAFFRGIQERAAAAAANTHGAVIPARSENDTGNNPHNPMYAIHAVGGADGELATLIGSQSSVSGGNSMAPAMTVDPSVRPTKVDRPSDVTGLVDTGDLATLLGHDDSVKVMEAIERISYDRVQQVKTALSTDTGRQAVVEKLLQCGYVKTAYLVNRYGEPSALDPEQDPDITAIFSAQELNDREFRKTASVMKMVVNGDAGAGTITMGGFDYHTGDRSTGELRDLRAGRCIGACLEYARRVGTPLMIYVFSDGSVFSNGMVDDSTDGRGKGVWTGDNQQTAASFMLVYNPGGRPAPNPYFGLTGTDGGPQIGYFTADGSVQTSSSPAANNVNLLVQMVVLNYLALHGEQGQFMNKWQSTYASAAGLGSDLDKLIAFQAVR